MMQWRPISELRKIERNYSGSPYSYEWAKKQGKIPKGYSEYLIKTYAVSISEEIELMCNADKDILYRITDNCGSGCTKEFITQLGVFKNDNRGEFGGQLITPTGESVGGNFIDVVNHKDKVYAIDSLNHLGLAHFNLLEFKSSDEYQTIYHTKDFMDVDYNIEDLEFGALYNNGQELYIVISGCISKVNNERSSVGCTKILKVTESVVEEIFVTNQTFNYIKSLVIIGDIAYVSMDKIVALISLSSGNVEYYTCISELAEKDLVQTRQRYLNV